MGIQMLGFKCPHCNTFHGPGGGPSYAKVAGVPTAPDSSVVALICIACEKAMGFYTTPVALRAQPGQGFG